MHAPLSCRARPARTAQALNTRGTLASFPHRSSRTASRKCYTTRAWCLPRTRKHYVACRVTLRTVLRHTLLSLSCVARCFARACPPRIRCSPAVHDACLISHLPSPSTNDRLGMSCTLTQRAPRRAPALSLAHVRSTRTLRNTGVARCGRSTGASPRYARSPPRFATRHHSHAVGCLGRR